MIRKSNMFQLPILAVSILIAVSLSYVQFSASGEGHSFAPVVALENWYDADGDDLAMAPPVKWEGFLPSSLGYPGQQIPRSFKDFPAIPSQPFSPREENFILRC